MHQMKNESYPGLGRWKICNHCGAARHGGLWWLAGYKSKAEPPCTDGPALGSWMAAASPLVEARDLTLDKHTESEAGEG